MIDEHSVGLRELRHKTSEVLRRVRAGETLDVTDRGTPIARLVPLGERDHEPRYPPRIQQLIDEGRITPAAKTMSWPTPLPGDGTNRLTDALLAERHEGR